MEANRHVEQEKDTAIQALRYRDATLDEGDCDILERIARVGLGDWNDQSADTKIAWRKAEVVQAKSVWLFDWMEWQEDLRDPNRAPFSAESAQLVQQDEMELHSATRALDHTIRELRPELECQRPVRKLDDNHERTQKLRRILKVINPRSVTIDECFEALENCHGDVKITVAAMAAAKSG